MAELIVVAFKKDMYRASDVLNQLQGMDENWAVDLHDAVAVYRDYKGKLRVDQSYQITTREGAGWGGLWGSLIGATLAIPFTAGASGLAAAGAIAAGAFVLVPSEPARVLSTPHGGRMSSAYPMISSTRLGR